MKSYVILALVGVGIFLLIQKTGKSARKHVETVVGTVKEHMGTVKDHLGDLVAKGEEMVDQIPGW